MRVRVDHVVVVLDDEGADAAVGRVARQDLVAAIVEIGLGQVGVGLAGVGQPGGRGRLEDGRLLDAEDDGHVGAFLHERVGAGEGHFADHRVGEQPRQHVAAEAELLFQLPLQLLVLGLDGEQPQETAAPLGGKVQQLVERLHRIELQEVLIGGHQPRDLGHLGLDLVAGPFLFEQVLVGQRGQLGRRPGC